MKAITIRQPRAHLIAHGQKFVENRAWSTSHRGWLAIHAGLNRGVLKDWKPDPNNATAYNEMVFGQIVAVVWMVGCIEFRDIAEYATQFPNMGWLPGHKHAKGPWCWVFSSVCRLASPVTVIGGKFIWDVPAKTLLLIRGRYSPKAWIRPGQMVAAGKWDPW